MPDDKSKRGGPDRSRVQAEEQYEVAYFAKKHKLTHAQATRIIKDAGSNRAKADATAERYLKR
jgi:hypothetical protein